MEIKDVEKLAKLARLEMPPAELEAVSKDLNSILGYIDQISELEVGPQRSNLKGSPRFDLVNVMREDADPHESGAFTAAILAEAPQTQDNFFKVRQIL